MKVIIGSTEGTVKKGMEIDLDSILDKIRNEFAGNIENWFFDEFMDLHIDMEIIEDGFYSENLEFYIEDDKGVSHNLSEFLKSHI
ncbi:hypothetical protein N9651_01275 [Flavobacteriales bacterium]|jgi:hypothetical protein|nr:hypothetical protein [Flavobacteriales bacterium]